MSSRDYIRNVVSANTSLNGQRLGDEVFDPISNRLFKTLPIGGTQVTNVEVLLNNLPSLNIATNDLTISANQRVLGNVIIDGTLTQRNAATFQAGGVTFNTATTFNSTLTGVSTLQLNGGTTSTTTLGTNASTGTTTIGGTAQTGTITFGQSTATQNSNVATGNTSAGNIKHVNLGTNSGPGSTTIINIGPIHPNANGNVIFNPATTVAIQNTRASTSNTTGALVVGGGVGITGNIHIRGEEVVTGNVTVNGNIIVANTNTPNTASIRFNAALNTLDFVIG